MAAEKRYGIVDRVNLLRVPLDSIPDNTMPELTEALLAEGGVSQILMLRWWDFVRVRQDRELRTIARNSALVVPVSKSLTLGARFLSGLRPNRHLPFDLVIRLLGALEDRKRSIYLLGGSPVSLRKVEQNLRETFPGLRVVGRYSGYSGTSVEADIITAIRKAEPDLLFLGGGLPSGRKWVSRHRSELGCSIAVHSPETFEVFAEKRKRISKSSFNRGVDFMPAFVRHPWRVVRLPFFLWYLFMLLIFKIFRL